MRPSGRWITTSTRRRLAARTATAIASVWVRGHSTRRRPLAVLGTKAERPPAGTTWILRFRRLVDMGMGWSKE